jgi:hypothetical protein
MVKLQKQKRGNLMVAIPKKIAEAQGWNEGEELTLYPCNNRVLQLIPLSSAE